jgi:hypothetical protein
VSRRRVWVLDTATKGTGAEMVPLDSVLRKPGEPEERRLPAPRRRRPAPPEPARRGPRRFRAVDVVTREVLADDADAPTLLEALGRVRSSVDVTVFVWEPDPGEWRLLSLAEQREVWRRRSRRRS